MPIRVVDEALERLRRGKVPQFPGRSGPGQLYLVSPYSVAASAVAGRVVGWEPGGE